MAPLMKKINKPSDRVDFKENKYIEKYLLKKMTLYKNFKLNFRRQTNTI